MGVFGGGVLTKGASTTVGRAPRIIDSAYQGPPDVVVQSMTSSDFNKAGWHARQTSNPLKDSTLD